MIRQQLSGLGSGIEVHQNNAYDQTFDLILPRMDAHILYLDQAAFSVHDCP